MAFALQMLRGLIEAHPDRAARLLTHVEALETSIEAQPAFCLQNVRTLFEAAQETIAPILGVTFGKRSGFPDRMRAVIDALDFAIDDHPNSAQVGETISQLLKGIDDTAVALARLSNIPNMRHGGSLDWGTLERNHAMMLGALCDALVGFLFEAAWQRLPQLLLPLKENYNDFMAYNSYLDEEHEGVEVAGSVFDFSFALFTLDWTKYEGGRQEWLANLALLLSESDAPA